VLLLRLKNVIVRSQFYLLREMKHAYEHDALTGLYNRTASFLPRPQAAGATRRPKFALVRFDIDHFHLLNSFWGEEEGDRFLRFVADCCAALARGARPAPTPASTPTPSASASPMTSRRIRGRWTRGCEALAAYNRNYLIEPSFGVYVIDDPAEKIQSHVRAGTLAAKECKGRYMPICAITARR
jgi:hypothetical protein